MSVRYVATCDSHRCADKPARNEIAADTPGELLSNAHRAGWFFDERHGWTCPQCAHREMIFNATFTVHTTQEA